MAIKLLMFENSLYSYRNTFLSYQSISNSPRVTALHPAGAYSQYISQSAGKDVV